jgi:hypothetical protein
MAQKVQVILVDDVDGGEAEESVSFALDGAAYEIDLSTKNAEALRAALATGVGHARRVSGRGRPRAAAAGRGKSVKRADRADVRTWARSNGHDVSDRGRISSEVIDAYDAAH